MLRSRGAAGFADGDRIEPPRAHRLEDCRRQRRLPRPFGPLENEKEAVHERVMMLLVAPFSIPAAICSFTRVISLSKFVRATT